MNTTPQQPEPSALIRDHVEDPKNNGDYRLDITGQPLTDLWRACERVEGELRATRAELASERAAGASVVAEWRRILYGPSGVTSIYETTPELRDALTKLCQLAAPTQPGKVGP